MADLLTYTILGLVIGSAYAIAASGLVITYATSSVFNMAHGAVGMVMAFLYWELSVNRGLPTWLALLLVVGVAAPLFGAILERVAMRRLVGASVTVTLTVTVGVLVALFGAAQLIWPQAGRSVPAFLPDRALRLGDIVVDGHQVVTFVLALVVAGGLYLLLSHTRTGVAMRALVDDRELLSLHGARPQLLAALSWAIGSALAALAGILLVREVGLGYLELTFLVINAYAAAMVGRLVSLPRTFVGAMILGLAQSYFLLGLMYLPRGTSDVVASLLSGIRSSLPTLLLLLTMLLLPQEKLRVGSVAGTKMTPVPSRARALRTGAAFLVAVVALTQLLDTSRVAALAAGLAFALIMLSLVLLAGYGGDVSLGHMAFVGVGALLVARVFGTAGPAAMVTAAVVAALLGALVALPTLRLRGLYLGLGTLAFAFAMDKLVFENPQVGFDLGAVALIERPTILGLSLVGERAFTITTAVAFVLVALGVLELRRGRFGRLLLAARDSPAACSTLGTSVARIRVLTFSLSAGLAGLAGVFLAGVNLAVGPTDFTMFQNLPLLLLLVIGGVTSITGALIGGLLFGFAPAISGGDQAVGFVLIGVTAAVVVTRWPNGIAGLLFGRFGAGAGERDGVTAEEADNAEEEHVVAEVSPVGAP